MSAIEYSKILICAVIISIAPIACQVSTQLPREQKKTEIVFVATHHATLLLHPDFSPAHLRALLSKIDPAAISVEKLSDWRDRGYFFTFPQEWYATYTWAEERGIPIYGVDWSSSAEDKEEAAVSLEPRDTSTVEQRWEEFQTHLTGLGKWEASQAFGESNGIESFQRNTQAKIEPDWFLQLPPDERAFLDTRDDHIAENILNVAREYPGKRIAVVYGSLHCPRISNRLLNQTEVTIVSALQFFPFTPEEVASGWYKDDAILLLGANLDSWVIPGVPQARDHRRTRELLNKLKLSEPESSVTHYYQAKWRLLYGDLEGAEKILNEILSRRTCTAIPYFPDRRWCWPPLRTFEQKALFALATVYDLKHKHDRAVNEYRKLLRILEEENCLEVLAWRNSYYDLGHYLQDLIETPYRGGAWEAFRAWESICWHKPPEDVEELRE